MAIPFHKPISSIEAIERSIETDPQVFRWFLSYIIHPNIQSLSSGTTELSHQYKKLRSLEAYTWLTMILFTGTVLSYFVTHKPFLPWLLIPILWAFFKITTLRRSQVSSISRILLLRDKEKIQFESKTLFQICEIYGKNLKIPTLVDTITRQDAIMRRTFIFACVTTCFLYPADFWTNWIIVGASLFVIHTIINTPIVFDRLH